MSFGSIADRPLHNAIATRRVLIADDEAAITQTLSLILERNGYHTVVAPTGEEAVQLARASAPDVVISDIVMPGISGIEAAIQIRDLCPECRILLISGETVSAELLEQARSLGHEFEVLAKPFPPDRLLDWLGGGAIVSQAGM